MVKKKYEGCFSFCVPPRNFAFSCVKEHKSFPTELTQQFLRENIQNNCQIISPPFGLMGSVLSDKKVQNSTLGRCPYNMYTFVPLLEEHFQRGPSQCQLLYLFFWERMFWRTKSVY